MTASTRAPGPGAVLAAVLAISTALVWGSTWLVIKLGLRDLPPLTGAGLRFALAGAVMALVARWLGAREGGAPPARWMVLTHGLCQFAGNYAIVYFGETLLPSGLVSVLWSVFPLFVGLFAHFLLASERLGVRQWLGLCIAFAGIVLLFATDLRAISARALAVGALVLLAPASVALSTALIRRHATGTSSLLLNRDAMLVGAGVLLVGGLVLERDRAMSWSPLAFASIAYLALLGTVFTFGVQMWLLRYVPATRLSLASFLSPPFALFLGAALVDEPVGATTLLGAGVVLGGVALSTLRRSA